jgi:hypothetical protein
MRRPKYLAALVISLFFNWCFFLFLLCLDLALCGCFRRKAFSFFFSGSIFMWLQLVSFSVFNESLFLSTRDLCMVFFLELFSNVSPGGEFGRQRGLLRGHGRQQSQVPTHQTKKKKTQQNKNKKQENLNDKEKQGKNTMKTRKKQTTPEKSRPLLLKLRFITFLSWNVREERAILFFRSLVFSFWLLVCIVCFPGCALTDGIAVSLFPCAMRSPWL